MPHLRSVSKHVVNMLVVATLIAPGACTADTSTAPATGPSTSHPDDPPPMHFDSTSMVIKGKQFTIELALTDAQEQRGLMYRDAMPEDHGMLFVFDAPKVQKFWMKNTRIPLDIVFIDKDGRLVEVERAKPLDETGVGPDAPTQFVIELNAGMADKLGLKKGDRIDVPEKYLKGA